MQLLLRFWGMHVECFGGSTNSSGLRIKLRVEWKTENLISTHPNLAFCERHF